MFFEGSEKKVQILVHNEKLSLQLQQSKSKITIILDSLRTVKADLSLISKYKNQVSAFIKK